MELEKIGEWAFIAGVIIAIVAGAAAVLIGITPNTDGTIVLVLVILGLIVGFLNIKDKEITTFLIAAIALIAVGSAQLTQIDDLIPSLGTLLQTIVLYVKEFVVPAALVVALKAVYGIARTTEVSKLAK